MTLPFALEEDAQVVHMRTETQHVSQKLPLKYLPIMELPLHYTVLYRKSLVQ